MTDSTQAGPAQAGTAKNETGHGNPEHDGREQDVADHPGAPQVMLCAPEVAAVGLTERQAVEAGPNVRTVDVELSSVAGTSLSEDGVTGPARLVIDTARQVVIGATLVGPDVAELLRARDHRRRRAGAAGAAVARCPGVPDRVPGVAAAAGGLRPRQRGTRTEHRG